MIAEYLNDIDYPTDSLIRLFDFDLKEVNQFRDQILQIVIENKNSLDLSELSFIKQIDCNLKFELFNENVGIEKKTDRDFVCRLTIDGYKTLLDYLEPFCNGNLSGYQWLLYETSTPIELLLSQNGTW